MESGFMNIEEQRRWNDPKMWKENGDQWSGYFGGTPQLWNTYIFDTVKPFRNKRILEIAPGFGRMTQYLVVLASHLVVVDLNPLCIQATRDLLGDHVDAYFVNDGKSLRQVDAASQDLVFSWDSFVHMHANVVRAYVAEIRRTLAPGGYGFVHHADFTGGQELSFRNVAGRANMSPTLFADFVRAEGLAVVSQRSIDFPQITDCITTFRKE